MQTRQTTTLPEEQFSVADGNWNADRGPIQGIVLHTMAGTLAGTDARFNTPNVQVSAHYGVGLDGKLYQWVDEDNVAFHAGNYLINQTTIGIEHEDATNPQTNPTGYNNPRPDALYETSAQLVAELCGFYDFPADKEHIFRHQDVIDKTVYKGGTACPDALDTDRIIARAAEILTPPVVQTPIVEQPVTPQTPTTSPAAEIPIPVSPAQPSQTDANSVSNTPEQTVTVSSEANSEASGQAGKVPLMVETPVSKPQQSNRLIPNWLVRLIMFFWNIIKLEEVKS